MASSTQPDRGNGGSTAVARRDMTTRDLPAFITSSDQARRTIAPFLPEGVSLERVAATLRIALAKERAAWKKEGPSPLERCSPMSVFLAVAKICHWGLEAGETAHLVPFGTECTPIADYKGLVQLVIGSGVVRSVQVRCVYEKEPFRMVVGTSVEIEHRPIGAPSARGKMIGAYAIFDLRRGAMPVVKYLSVEEIEGVRQRYSKQWKEGALQPWYAEKTVIRAGAKILPKDPKLAKTLAVFEQTEAAEIEALAVPEELRRLESGSITTTVPDDDHRKPLVIAGDGAYGEPAPPAQPAPPTTDEFDDLFDK